jgi:hypothetical protein
MDYQLWQSAVSKPAVRVTIYLDEEGKMEAKVERTGPFRDGEDYSFFEIGEPAAMLDWGNSLANKYGADLYVRLDGAKWDPAWGSLSGV